MRRKNDDWPEGSVLNDICLLCAKECKQLASSQIIFCPNFQDQSRKSEIVEEENLPKKKKKKKQ